MSEWKGAAVRKVLDALSQGPLTVGELGIETGYSESFIQVLLVDLQRDWLVTMVSRRPSRAVHIRGIGRPQNVYALNTEGA